VDPKFVSYTSQDPSIFGVFKRYLKNKVLDEKEVVGQFFNEIK